MIKVTKEFKWDMAHMLAGHQGLCKNLHGHTYKMEVTVAGDAKDVIVEGESAGMVIDFKDLKRVVNGLIVDKFDHALVLNVQSDSMFEQELYELAKKYNKKVVELDYRPTAELMAQDFIKKINTHAGLVGFNWVVTELKLWETPTSYATVTLD